MKKLKTAVIGVGNIGQHHARIFSSLKQSNLVAVADSNEAKGKEIAKKFCCNFYADYGKMLEKEKPDVVSICVPTGLHKTVAMLVASKSINFLVEKPISDSIESAKAIIEAAEKNSVKMTVGHLERFNPAVAELKSLIDAGKLGEVISINAKRVGLLAPQIVDTNIIVDVAIHDIDVFNYLLSRKPDKSWHLIGRALASHTDDYAEILLKYGKINGFIQVNWVTPIKIRRLAVTGTKGYAELDYINQELVVFETNYQKSFNDFGDYVLKFGQPTQRKIEIEKKEPLLLELESFLDCIIAGKEPKVSAKDALLALDIALNGICLSR